MKASTLAVLLAGLLLAACAGKPLEESKWQNSADDIRPGPGLFTGDDGEFVIYGQ